MSLSLQSPIVVLEDDVKNTECVGVDDNNALRASEDRRERKEKRGIGKRYTSTKKTTRTPVGGKELQELMQLAEYEVNQDPYRGMGFLKHSSHTGNGQNASVRGGNETPKFDKFITPWDICQWGILSKRKNKRITHQDQGDNSREYMTMGGNEMDSAKVLDPNDAKNLVHNLTESGCPSIISWTKGHVEEENKRKQQSQKNRKQRSSVERKRSRPPIYEQEEESVSNSLKIHHLGLRPSDTKYSSFCDSNPFCLGSMGGVVNEVLKERCHRGIIISIMDKGFNISDEAVSNGGKRAKIFSFDGDSNNGKDKKSHDAKIEIIDLDKQAGIQSEGSNSVMEFAGGPSALNDKTKNVEDKTKSQKVATMMATCNELSPGGGKTYVGESAEVYTAKADFKHYPFNEDSYSQKVKDEMHKLRRCENIDFSNVERFIKSIFQRMEHSNSKKRKTLIPIDEYIKIMIEWHKSLIFVNPMTEESNVSGDKVTIALPPGIENLGATCYLNTQLQCLAQNPVFLDGIFAWRPVNAAHHMNGVMERLQNLLAQLVVGGNGQYTSLDFSNALGIQHNEQQDPNEFARLLFARMEESFQQCSIAGSGRGNVKGDALGKLLQRIFHGTTTYKTICMKCGNASIRNEGFMDLNLPIVQRQPYEVDDMDDADDTGSNYGIAALSKRKRRKKGPIDLFCEKKKKPVDTDVQYCFDQYMQSEVLDGDNQYFCDVCNCKQDAKRIMSLTELPPVLNIQLSRYVFDRKKLVKKKLTDKVRLPTVLSIDRKNIDGSGFANSSARASKQNMNKKYLLCGVMKHQGTSAYSGHYIAEAMDWTSGQWYVFNDETVKVLPAPSNSYVPCNGFNSEEEKLQNDIKSNGSQDAYNMYYVDEEYLGENAIKTILRYKRLNSFQHDSNKVEFEDIDVLRNVIREKEQSYSRLTELCYDDYAIMDRLIRRKDAIRKCMFVDPSSLLLESQWQDNDIPYFWVDGETLRQFLACDRSLDDKLKSCDPLVCPASLLCKHGFLHPRNARRGKLLRKPLYDSYVSLLSAERKFLSVTDEVKHSVIIGRTINSKETMTCEDCSTSYRKELSKKLEVLRNVNDLYLDIIDETTDSTNSSKGEKSEEHAYIVARSAITKFKKLFVDLMKKVADFEKGGYFNSAKVDSKNSSIFNGIDDLDTSFFPGSPVCTMCANADAKADHSLDEKINSKITCMHGNCTEFSLRIVRYVPCRTWTKVKKVFPNAIEHKVSIYSEDGTSRKPNIEDDGCVHCRMERNATNNLIVDIEKWAKETKENFSLKKVIAGQKYSREEIALHNFDRAQNNCRLVHRDDISNLSRSVRLLSRVSKQKINDKIELKTFAENIAFPVSNSFVMGFEKQPCARLFHSLRSLICREHKRVIKSAIVDSSGSDGETKQRHKISAQIAVLSDEEFNAYIDSLVRLLLILNRNSNNNQHNADHILQPRSLPLLDDVKKDATSCFPEITKIIRGENTAAGEVLSISLDGNSNAVSIMPGLCEHGTCKKKFSLFQKKNPNTGENDSEDSGERREKKRSEGEKRDCRLGTAAMRPIVVESDLEDCTTTDPVDSTSVIRVYQFTDDSETIDVLQSLSTAAGFTNSDQYEGLNFGLRRSTRRRKTRFPIGCITDEKKINIGLHHNVAALRLLLYQNCQIPLNCKLSIAVILDNVLPPKSLEIAFDGSTETLSELIERLKVTGDDAYNLLETNAAEHVFLLYQVDKDCKPGDIETVLMDSLLQVSNIESPDSKSNPKKAKSRSSERGFQGTLLQSSTSSRTVGEEANKVGDSLSCCQSEESPNNLEIGLKSKKSVAENKMEESPSRSTKVKLGVMSNYSSDDEVTIVPSPLPQLKMCNEIDDAKKMELVSKLMKLSESNDESCCFEAVSWAMKASPEKTEAAIVDSALSKLFEKQSEVTE